MRRSTKQAAAPSSVRCAIYTRKSHEDGLELDFNSLDAQREAGEAYVASQKGEGWTCLPERYDDGGFSGGDMERPGLRRLVADIEAGRIDVVVVYKVDRLSRSLFDFADLVKVFEQHGVTFVAVTQHFNTTDAMGRLTLNILLSFAQFEREIIGERIRDKIAAQRKRGKWSGGTPVLGYDVDRTGGSPRLIVNAGEAARVRAIFDLYRDHQSLLKVAEVLAERGWRTKAWRTKAGVAKGDRPFDRGNLYTLLTNPIYVGKVKHKDDVFDGEHEAIVTAEVFRDVQKTMERNGRTGGAAVRNKHGALLKGLLTCKACQSAMVHTFTGRGDRRYRYYTCSSARRRGRATCPTGTLPAAEIERAVVDEIRGIAEDTVLRDEVLRQSHRQVEHELDDLGSEARALERELRWHHGEIRKVTGGKRSPAATARLADLQERVGRADGRLAEVRARIAAVERERLNAADVATAFADFDGLWNALNPREQAKVLALLVAGVAYDVDEGAIEVSFHPSAIKSLSETLVGDAA